MRAGLAGRIVAQLLDAAGEREDQHDDQDDDEDGDESAHGFSLRGVLDCVRVEDDVAVAS